VHNCVVGPWEIEGTGEFAEWYGDLTDQEQARVDSAVADLEIGGPALGRPRIDTVKKSRHKNMKELRTQAAGDPLRILFAFDPRRVAILLIGGDKTGDDRFYERMIPRADDLYDAHLAHLKETDDHDDCDH